MVNSHNRLMLSPCVIKVAIKRTLKATASQGRTIKIGRGRSRRLIFSRLAASSESTRFRHQAAKSSRSWRSLSRNSAQRVGHSSSGKRPKLIMHWKTVTNGPLADAGAGWLRRSTKSSRCTARVLIGMDVLTAVTLFFFAESGRVAPENSPGRHGPALSLL